MRMGTVPAVDWREGGREASHMPVRQIQLLPLDDLLLGATKIGNLGKEAISWTHYRQLATGPPRPRPPRLTRALSLTSSAKSGPNRRPRQDCRMMSRKTVLGLQLSAAVCCPAC